MLSLIHIYIVKKAKPHVGTDILKNVVREMRREIIKNGGEVRFRTPLTGVSVKNEMCIRDSPINTAKDIVDELIQNGYVSGRPSIGITGQNVESADGRVSGVQVYSIDSRAKAASEGLQVGDVITAVEDVYKRQHLHCAGR